MRCISHLKQLFFLSFNIVEILPHSSGECSLLHFVELQNAVAQVGGEVAVGDLTD
jgi:hypothetical protein